MISNFDESALILAIIIIIPIINIFLCKINYHLNFNSVFSLSIIQALSSLALFITFDDGQSLTWDIFHVNNIVNLSIYINKYSIILLNLINFINLALLIFFEKYLQIFDKNNHKKTVLFIMYFLLSVNLLVICANLISSIFVIGINILLSNSYFNEKYKDSKSHLINSLNFVYYFQFALLFILLIFFVIYFNNNSFYDNKILFFELHKNTQYYFYILIYFALFLLVLTPFYLFYYFTRITIIDEFIVIIISYLLPYIIVFTKLIFYIFDFNFLPIFIIHNKLYLDLFIIVNLIFLAFAMVYNKFKKNLLTMLSFYSLFYLFFSFFISNKDNHSHILFLTIGFIINIISLFMMILPFNLLQNKMNNPSLQGLFFLMPKSCILLIISILNLIGLTPSFNMINNYQILTNLSAKMTIISISIILFFNIFIMVFLCFFLKLIFSKVSIDRNQEDINLINTFENEQNLVFSRIAIIILSIVFFLFRKFFIL